MSYYPLYKRIFRINEKPSLTLIALLQKEAEIFLYMKKYISIQMFFFLSPREWVGPTTLFAVTEHYPSHVISAFKHNVYQWTVVYLARTSNLLSSLLKKWLNHFHKYDCWIVQMHRKRRHELSMDYVKEAFVVTGSCRCWLTTCFSWTHYSLHCCQESPNHYMIHWY